MDPLWDHRLENLRDCLLPWFVSGVRVAPLWHLVGVLLMKGVTCQAASSSTFFCPHPLLFFSSHSVQGPLQLWVNVVDGCCNLENFHSCSGPWVSQLKSPSLLCRACVSHTHIWVSPPFSSQLTWLQWYWTLGDIYQPPLLYCIFFKKNHFLNLVSGRQSRRFLTEQKYNMYCNTVPNRTPENNIFWKISVNSAKFCFKGTLGAWLKHWCLGLNFKEKQAWFYFVWSMFFHCFQVRPPSWKRFVTGKKTETN